MKKKMKMMSDNQFNEPRGAIVQVTELVTLIREGFIETKDSIGTTVELTLDPKDEELYKLLPKELRLRKPYKVTVSFDDVLELLNRKKLSFNASKSPTRLLGFIDLHVNDILLHKTLRQTMTSVFLKTKEKKKGHK